MSICRPCYTMVKALFPCDYHNYFLTCPYLDTPLYTELLSYCMYILVHHNHKHILLYLLSFLFEALYLTIVTSRLDLQSSHLFSQHHRLFVDLDTTDGYPCMRVRPTYLLNSKNTREKVENTELSSRDIQLTPVSYLEKKRKIASLSERERYKPSYVQAPPPLPRLVADMLEPGGDSFAVVTQPTGIIQGPLT